MSMLDGDLMLILWRRRRELGRTPPTPRKLNLRLPRLMVYPIDNPWPVLRNYPYGHVS